MDDDPGHICGSLLRLCAICSTITLSTFGCCCGSRTPFPIHLQQKQSVCLSSRAFSHLSHLSQWVCCMEKEAPVLLWSPGQTLSLPVPQHGCYLMSLAAGSWWQLGLGCQGALCHRGLTIVPRHRMKPLHVL